MNKRRRTLSRRTTLVIAMLSVFGLAPAQSGYNRLEADLSDATTTVTDSIHQRPEGPTSIHVTTRPIGDDGGSGDDWCTTRQLVIALSDDAPTDVHVALMNEAGQEVRSERYTTSIGQRTVPVDVSGLVHGRYAARISTGSTDRVVRFRR